MSADEQVPEGIDVSVATIARMYDYILGGHNNFAVDRRTVLKIAEHSPEVLLAARAGRAFLQRAVRFLTAEAGIRQFLDLGTGLPTTGNVHQIAQAIAPAARVIYVDSDPMVLAHSRALKTGDQTAVINADLRDADAILNHPDTGRLIDFSEPLAVLFVAVLHYVPDPEAQQAVAAFTSVAAPGSYLAVSHAVTEADPEGAEQVTAQMAKTANPATLRTRQQVLAFFDGTDLVEPGLVPVHQWRPDDASPVAEGSDWAFGGIGRLRPDHVRVPVTAVRAARVSALPDAPSPQAGAAALGQAAVSAQPPDPRIGAGVATAARMYDYWLGGHNNFAADRIAALKIAERAPEVPLVARENRAFLQRAVRFLTAGAGIRQFLDLGTGLPTTGNVHQIAQGIAPEARVVYVDKDPMVAAHSRALKTGDGTAVIQADLRDADLILNHEDTRRLIDFSQPLALLFVAVLPFIVDDSAARASVARYLSAVTAGSYLVLSHGYSAADPETMQVSELVYARTASPARARSRAEILAFFTGTDLVEPGLVPVWQWRPSRSSAAEPGKDWALGGVGRKTA